MFLSNLRKEVFLYGILPLLFISAITLSGSIAEAASPNTPTNLDASRMGNAVLLSWATSSDGGSAITKHRYRYSNTDNQNTWTDGDVPDSAEGETNETQYTVTNLDIGEEYIFQVQAVNSDGSSAWTESSSDVEVPYGYHFVKNRDQSSNDSVGVYPQQSSAVGFTTGPSDSDHKLASVKVRFGTNVQGQDNLIVTINNASGNNPGDTVLYTLDNPSSLNAGTRTFTIPNGTDATLSANTDYFVVFSGAADIGVRRTHSDDEDEHSAVGWSIADRYKLKQPGGSWGNSQQGVFQIGIYTVEKPKRPRDFNAIATGNDVTLTWTEPWDGGSSVLRHQYRSREDGNNHNNWTDIPNSAFGETNATSTTINDLPDGKTYVFDVRAVTAVGIGDDAFNVWEAVRPAIPAGLSGSSPGIGHINLTWTAADSDDTITEYQYRYKKTSDTNFGSWSTISGSDINTTEYTITGLDGGETYDIDLKALNDAGSSLSATTSTTVLIIPIAPTGFSGTANNDTVDLTWSDPSDSTITGYQYQQKEGSGSFGIWTDILNSAPGETNATGYTITGLSLGKTYGFKLRAVNDNGHSYETTAISVVMKPVQTVGLTATSSDTNVTLAWANPNNDTITMHQYQQKEGSDDFGSWTDILNSGADDTNFTSYTVTGLTLGETYRFKVRASNISGEGLASAEAEAIMRPATPSNLSATADSNEITLTWDDPGNNTITSYEYSIDNGVTFSPIPNAHSTTTTHTITDLNVSTKYNLAIKAKNQTGESDQATLTINTLTAVPIDLDLIAANDSGLSDRDNVTKQTDVTVRGCANTGTAVTLYSGNNELSESTADGNDCSLGSLFTANLTLNEAVHTITAKAKDPDDNLGVASLPLSLTVDLTAPLNSPGNFALGSHPNEYTAGSVTEGRSVEFVGTTDSQTVNADDYIVIYNGEGVAECEEPGGCRIVFEADADGKTPYAFTLTRPNSGLHPISIKYYDRAGNISDVVSSFDLTVNRRKQKGGTYLPREEESEVEESKVEESENEPMTPTVENNQTAQMSVAQRNTLITMFYKISEDFKNENLKIVTVVKNPNLTLAEKRVALSRWYNNQTIRLRLMDIIIQMLARRY